jgi:hypothetical protein
MGDPFFIASGVAGLFSLSIQVTESLLKYYQAIKGLSKDVGRAITKLKSPVDCSAQLTMRCEIATVVLERRIYFEQFTPL